MLRKSFQSRYCFLWLLIVSSLIITHIIQQRYKPNDGYTSNGYLKRHKISSALPERYLSNQINKYNSALKIRNVDIYGHIKENTVIFVILMDKFLNEFVTFLSSLSEVEGIGDALLIFSHSYYDEDVNKIIASIDFCRVVQIFYPYSLQTHSQAFPGQDPRDCPTNLNKKIAAATKCNGAFFPDFRGHYRNPALAEQKHHWWWTSNTVFETLNCTTKDSGLVIFLEDDFYFIKDFIYMALYMQNVAGSLTQCELLSLGTTSSPDLRENKVYGAELSTWDPKFHSSILAFDLNTWNIIVSHYDLFCSVDDSSWLNSLYYISLNRKDGDQFKVMTSLTPRAFKMSSSNLYNMFGVSKIKELEWFRISTEGEWFPSHIELYINVQSEDSDTDIIFDYKDSVGGWADPRDKELCIKMTTRKMKKVLMEMVKGVQNDDVI